MSSLRDRLTRLRAHSASARTTEDALSPDAAAEPAGSEDASSAKGCDRAEAVRAGDRAGIHASDGSEGAGTGSGSGEKGGPFRGLHPALTALNVEEIAGEFGRFLRRRAVYPLEHRHGHYVLTELMSCAVKLKPIAARQNRKRGRQAADVSSESPDIEAQRLLFLDTETTGLGVGTGNLPFMIGFGYADGAAGTFTVEQLLIRHPGEERAMLAYLLGKFAGVTHLVTYNGRSFDWPVLTSRFVLNGWRPSGVEPGHLDFLHPSRALWKNTLPSCRLSRIEEDRLGILRGEDVPGSLAPELYMKYLSDGDASHLRGVYIHNERDILTLASLAVHFGGVLEGRLGADWALPKEPEELFRTAAWLAEHGGERHAERLFAALCAEGTPGGRWLLPAAARLKRLGRHEEAAELWERAAGLAESRLLPSAEAHIELSMHYEHRRREPGAALEYASRALELLQRRTTLRQSDRARAELDAIRHRMARLRRKLEAAGRPG